MKMFLTLLLVILPLIGLSDAGYITYEKFSGKPVVCGEGFDCGKVLNSEWASIGPVPLSLLGMLFYAVVLVLAIALFLELDPLGSRTQAHKLQKITPQTTARLLTPLHLLLPLTAFGALYSLYLIFLMGVILQAWCLYCLISAATSFSLFIVVLTYIQVAKPSLAGLRIWLAALFNWKYTHLLKPLFFLIDPETIHDFMTTAGETLGKFSLGRWLTRMLFGYQDPALAKTLDGITFPSPIGLAAGFDYNGRLTQILPSLGFGFHTIGTVTLHPYAGNPKPRLGRFPKSQGLLVNKGLKSWGAYIVARHLEKLPLHIPTGISIASTNKLFSSTREQLLDIAESFLIFEKSAVKHVFYEMNISCPNTFGGEPFTSPERLEILLQLLDQLNLTRPVYIKMPIDQSEALSLALLRVAAAHDIAGVIFGNLTKDKNNPAIDSSERELWSHQKGNVSGKPTWDRSNALLSLAQKHFPGRFTLIGTGGVFSPLDVERKQQLGADLCQLITGMIFQGPQLIGQINAWLALRNSAKSS
jgi:dihydroorotate dehydrogenase